MCFYSSVRKGFTTYAACPVKSLSHPVPTPQIKPYPVSSRSVMPVTHSCVHSNHSAMSMGSPTTIVSSKSHMLPDSALYTYGGLYWV